MTDPLNISTAVQRLPTVQQMAHADLAKAEVFQNVLNPVVAREQQKEGTKVQTVDKKEKLESAKREGGGRGGQEHPSHQREREPGEEEHPSGSNSSPWSGHLIDVKI
jgi:hypothetical protein